MINQALRRQLLREKKYYLTVVLSLAFTLSMVFSVFPNPQIETSKTQEALAV